MLARVTAIAPTNSQRTAGGSSSPACSIAFKTAAPVVAMPAVTDGAFFDCS